MDRVLGQLPAGGEVPTDGAVIDTIRVRFQLIVSWVHARTLTAPGASGVFRDRSQFVAVGAGHVGQYVCVAGAAFGSGQAEAVTASGGL